MRFDIPMLMYGISRVRNDAYEDANDLSWLQHSIDDYMDPSVRKCLGDSIEKVAETMKGVMEALDGLYVKLIKLQTSEETKEMVESESIEDIGKTVDVVIDKKGRRWPIIKLHEGIYGFRDCPFCAQYNKSGENEPFEESDAYKATIKWLDENMTPGQRKRWGEPFLASLFNIMGEKAHEYAKPVEGEVQFDYYKDWHNRVKSCPDLYECEHEFGAWHWTSSPYSDNPYVVCCIDCDGKANLDDAFDEGGVSPCFAIKPLNLILSGEKE